MAEEHISAQVAEMPQHSNVDKNIDISKLDPKDVVLSFGTDSYRAPPGTVEKKLKAAEEHALTDDDATPRRPRRREERATLARGWYESIYIFVDAVWLNHDPDARMVDLCERKLLSDSDIRMALTVDTRKITDVIARRVVCASCRKAVSGLLESMGHTKDPRPLIRELFFLPGGQIAMDGTWKAAIDKNKTEELLWKSFITCDSGDDVCEVNRRSRRCKAHSTDARKGWSSWLELWLALPPDSVAQLLLVHLDMFEHTYLADWLDRHRVCEHCRPRILGALDYLVDGPDPMDPESTASYDPVLFDGLEISEDGGWIRVGPDIKFVDNLLGRAMVNRRTNEVHATTDAVGQERVLECLAELLHERLQLLAQKLQDEELCWTILYHLGVESIREQFWDAVDKKHGAKSIDELLADINSDGSSEKEQSNPKKKAKKQKQKERARQKKLAAEAAKATETATTMDGHSCNGANMEGRDDISSRNSANKGKQARLEVPTIEADRDSGCEGSMSSAEIGGAGSDESYGVSQALKTFHIDSEEERRLLLAMGWNGNDEDDAASDFALTDEEIRAFRTQVTGDALG